MPRTDQKLHQLLIMQKCNGKSLWVPVSYQIGKTVIYIDATLEDSPTSVHTQFANHPLPRSCIFQNRPADPVWLLPCSFSHNRQTSLALTCRLLLVQCVEAAVFICLFHSFLSSQVWPASQWKMCFIHLPLVSIKSWVLLDQFCPHVGLTFFCGQPGLEQQFTPTLGFLSTLSSWRIIKMSKV